MFAVQGTMGRSTPSGLLLGVLAMHLAQRMALSASGRQTLPQRRMATQQMGASAAGQLGQLGHMSGNQSSLSAPQQCEQLTAIRQAKECWQSTALQAAGRMQSERASAQPSSMGNKHILGTQSSMS